MREGGRVNVDVLIMTALLDELEAVLELGEGGRSGWRDGIDPDGLPYHVRSIPRTAGRPLSLAAAWCGDMGEVATVFRARSLAEHLKPHWLAMCGICAGRRGAVTLGDVIVADRVFSYDHGKLIASTGPDGQRQEEIFRDITTYNMRDPWFTKVAYFARDLTWSAELAARRPVSLEQQSRWLLRTLLEGEDILRHPARPVECPDWRRTLQYLERRTLIVHREHALGLTERGRAEAQRDRIESLDAPPRDPPFRVHVGPIATGKTVRVDPEIFDRIRQFARNAIGIEMEAMAIGYVADKLHIPSLIVKAVSDHADHDKDDGFRAFACRASARFVLEFFLRQELDAAIPSGGTFYRRDPAPDLAGIRTVHAPSAVETVPPHGTAYAPGETARSGGTAYAHGTAGPTPNSGTIRADGTAGTARSGGTAYAHGTARSTPNGGTIHADGMAGTARGGGTDYADDAAAPPPGGTSHANGTARGVGGTGCAPSATEAAPPVNASQGTGAPKSSSPSWFAPSRLASRFEGYPPLGGVLGHWRLVRKLGSGGMGAVFEVEHVAMGKTAAAKILHPHLSNSEFVQRFLNEARAVAQIKHPGVMDIYDFAADGDIAYIIMELLAGVNLGQLIERKGRLPEPDALAIAIGTAEALVAAHRRQVVHRDLKPANIFVIDDSAVASGRRIKVIDFGIAKLAGKIDVSLTREHQIMGTPSYMSPEQWKSSRNVDTRSDQYSLGCTLFEMLAGRPPFTSEEIVSMFDAHLHQQPPRLGSLVSVSPQVDRIVARMLTKDPAARFPYMDDVVLALVEAVKAIPASSVTAQTAVPRQRPPEPTVFQSDDALDRVVPPHFRADMPAIRAFLQHVSSDYVQLGANTLRLTTPRGAGVAGFEFFAFFLSGVSGAEGQLGTITFMQQAMPIEHYLATIDRDARKVVIVLTDSFEFGRGVREKILDYRNRLDALVVPIYVGELRKAHRAGKLETLFMDRFADFQPVPDLYAASGPLSDPTRFFGMRRVLDELIAELEAPRRIAVIHGLPGSGRSSLVRMADYGMSAARFVYVASRDSDVAALAARIETSLGHVRGNLGAAARAASHALRPGRLVLVLEDADPLLGRLTDSAASEPALRELWTALAELAHDQVMSTLATTVRGFALGQRIREGRANPFAADVHLIEVPRLERETVARLLRDLGAQMNVTVTEGVVAECAKLSGGNIDVVRRLASEMLKYHRREAAHHALRAVELTHDDLRRVVEELVASRRTFEVFLSWLSPAEQRVLRGASDGRLRNAADLAAADLLAAEADAALDELRLLGLVERAGPRERLTIPLLGLWAKRHLAAVAPSSRWWLRRR